MIACKYTHGINPNSRYIRERVFVEEQGFREEFDELDAYVDTLVIYVDGVAAATGRLYEILDDKPHTFKLGRIAVLKEYRHRGLGSLVLENMRERAITCGARHLYISAQCVAVPFYEKCGYTPYGNTYYEEHVEHISMMCDI